MAPGFWSRVREARLVRVLIVYLAASWVVLQVSGLLQDKLQLPPWVTPAVLLLLVAGLVVILATAWAQAHPASRAGRGEVPAPWELNIKDLAGSLAERRLPHLTWARAILGGVIAFSLLFGAVGIYVLLTERDRAEEGAGAWPSDRRMLLVLPFASLGAPEDEYFADGISDAITARLAGIHALGVISRQTAVQFKGSDKTARQIGEELRVDYILEGTVQRERPNDPTSRVRVIPQLVRIADDTHLWAATYDEEMTEVFRVQSEVAERVAQALEITLVEPERRALAAKPTENLQAYEYYLRGNAHFERRDVEEDVWTATEMYEKAAELDPDFALAHAALAQARIWLHWNFGRRDELAKAKAPLDKALALAPGLPEVQLAEGDFYYYGQRDYDKALEHYSRVLRQQPSNFEATAWIGWIRRRQGRWEEHVAQLEKALELNPRNRAEAADLADSYLRMRRYPEAQRHLDRAISLTPDIPVYYARKALLYLARDGGAQTAAEVLHEASRRIDPAQVLVQSRALIRIFSEEHSEALQRMRLESARVDTVSYYLAKAEYFGRSGRPQQALAYYDSARAVPEGRVQAQHDQFAPYSTLALAYAGLGRRDDAVRAGTKAVDALPVSRDAYSGPVRVLNLAEIYVMVGEYDGAIDQLETLLAIPSPISVGLLQVDPLWDPLRDHPRFQRLLKAGG